MQTLKINQVYRQSMHKKHFQSPENWLSFWNLYKLNYQTSAKGEIQFYSNLGASKQAHLSFECLYRDKSTSFEHCSEDGTQHWHWHSEQTAGFEGMSELTMNTIQVVFLSCGQTWHLNTWWTSHQHLPTQEGRDAKARSSFVAHESQHWPQY